MTQFDAPMDTGHQYGQPLRTSGIAIASIVCSAIFICPITTIIGPILGLVGLATISESKGTKGKGLCIAGILLGVILTIGWAVGSYFIFYKPFAFVMAGPDPALRAGFDGDVQAFQDAIYGPVPPRAEAQAFLDALRDRYGDYVGVEMDPQQNQQPQPGQASAPFSYILQFSNGTAPAKVELIFADPAQGKNWVMQVGAIEVIDPDLGNLRYPPAAEPMETETPADEPIGEGDGEG